MDPDSIKEIKKRKARWVGVFAVAILMASMGNVIICVYLLIVLRTLYLDSITSEAVRAMELNAAAATGVVLVSLSMYWLRLPAAVRTWEYKEWGKKFAVWLSILSALAVPLTLLFMGSLRNLNVRLQVYLLWEGIAANILVAWYFSRSKIKSIFVK